MLLAIGEAGALAARGTADAGTASTLDDSLLTHPNTDQLLGHNIYILNGVAQGDDRIISAFTPASDRVTVVPNWSATPTTTSEYVILKPPWRILQFIDGISDAIRLARESGILVPKVNYELIGQDLLMGQGNFVRWAAGTTLAPSGWTLDANSAILRRTEAVKTYLPYSARITSNGTNLGNLTLSITNFMAYRGRIVDLRGFIRSNTASRVTMGVTDGVTTNTSTALSAAGDLNEWQDSEEDTPAVADLTISDNPTALTVNLDISAGGAVQADFASVRLILKDQSMYEYDFPQGSEDNQYKSLYRIVLGHTNRDDFRPLTTLENRMRQPQRFGVIDRELTRRLWVRDPILQDQPVRLEGQTSQNIITSDDTNVQMNASFLALYAAWYAARSLPQSHEAHGKRAEWERRWNDLLRRLDTRQKAGSVIVYGW